MTTLLQITKVNSEITKKYLKAFVKFGGGIIMVSVVCAVSVLY